MSNLINGYDKAKWGIRPSDLIMLYPSVYEVKDEKPPLDGLSFFAEDTMSKGIHDKLFGFFNDKLFDVFITYGDNDQNVNFEMLKTLIIKLMELYGNFDDIQEKKYTQDNFKYHEHFHFRKYSDNLLIKVIYVEAYSLKNEKVGDRLICDYTDPVVMERINKMEFDIKKNSLSL